jgi:hypothetical protein
MQVGRISSLNTEKMLSTSILTSRKKQLWCHNGDATLRWKALVLGPGNRGHFMGVNKEQLGKTKFIDASEQTLKSEFGEDTTFQIR